jgi:CO dehydrogenase maturation factor
MKIAVTGKGGVGKTTLSALLASLYAAEGRPALAVDADPDANLGLALGFTPEQLAALTPVAKLSDLIAERTASDASGFSKFFKINPRVSDIPDRFSIEKDGVKLLVMGTVETGGAGCVCPEHVVLKRVISSLVLDRDDVVIMDMEAGLEHLGRGTAGMVDVFIVVVEPGARSVQTYGQIKKLASDLGVTRVRVVANKIRNEADREFIIKSIPEDDLLGIIEFSDEIMEADKKSLPPAKISGDAVAEVIKIKKSIMRENNGGNDEKTV